MFFRPDLPSLEKIVFFPPKVVAKKKHQTHIFFPFLGVAAAAAAAPAAFAQKTPFKPPLNPCKNPIKTLQNPFKHIKTLLKRLKTL